MELVDRYLQAVKFGLPKSQKQDIVAELSEDLHAQIQEQEATLGRQLNQHEVAAILKKFGPPMQVALRYQPQRYLIGPQVFPLYLFVLKLVWLCFFGPWFVIGVALDIFVAADRSGHYQALTGVLDHFWLAAVMNLFVVTVIFAVIERYQPQGIWQHWDPHKLPRVRDNNRILRSSSTSELSWYGVISLWWVGAFHFPSLPGLAVEPSVTISRFFFGPVLFLVVGHAAIAIVNAFRPWWTPRRALVRAALDALGLIVVGALLTICFTGGTFVTVRGAQLSTDAILAAEKWFTWAWVLLLLLWVEIGYCVGLVQDARRAMGRQPLSPWSNALACGSKNRTMGGKL
jgi:hypothetical protein